MTIINTNVKSLIAQDSLRVNNNNLATAMERLSTGKKINSASDDAAGLSISARMTSQIRGLNMAVKNANDGISLAQTAEGAMNEVTNMLQRMRELAVQAGNGTNSAADLASLNDEVGQLKAEIDRIANTTQFNNMNILDGSFAGKLQIGANADQTMDIAVQSVNTAKMGETADGVAQGATKAKVTIGGASTNVADYQGVSFNVAVNGVNKTVTLPVESSGLVNVGGAAAVQAPAVADRSLDMTATGQVGGIDQKSANLSTAANAKLLISLNGGAAQTIDISSSDYYVSTARATGQEVVNALQTELDDNAAFQGNNALTVSLTDAGRIKIEMANGSAGVISITSDSSAGTPAAVLANTLTGTAAGTDVALSTTTGSIEIGGTTVDLTGDTSFDVGTNHFDLTAAINAHGFDITKLTTDQFITVYNETAQVGGVQVSEVQRYTPAGNLRFVGVDPSAPVSSPFNNGSLVGATGINGTSSTVAFVDAFGGAEFGQNSIAVTAATNDTFNISVDGATAVDVKISAKTYYSMDEIADALQASIDASGAFTGDNAITVAASLDENLRIGLSFTNAAGKSIDIDGNFLSGTTGFSGGVAAVGFAASTNISSTTAYDSTNAAVNINAAVEPVGVGSVFTQTTRNFSASADLKKFVANVNGLGNVTLDLATAITDRGYDDTALTGQQLVNVLNDTFAANGQFTGNNAVTASLSSEGQIKLQVAGAPTGGGNPSIVLGTTTGSATFVGTVTDFNGGTAATSLTSDAAGGLVISTAGDLEKFGIADYAVSSALGNNKFTIAVGSNDPVTMTVASAVYTDAQSLVDEMNYRISINSDLAGQVTAYVSTDSETGDQSIGVRAVTGESVTFTGGLATDMKLTKTWADSNVVTITGAGTSLAATANSTSDTLKFDYNGVTYTATVTSTGAASATATTLQSDVDAAVDANGNALGAGKITVGNAVAADLTLTLDQSGDRTSRDSDSISNVIFSDSGTLLAGKTTSAQLTGYTAAVGDVLSFNYDGVNYKATLTDVSSDATIDADFEDAVDANGNVLGAGKVTYASVALSADSAGHYVGNLSKATDANYTAANEDTVFPATRVPTGGVDLSASNSVTLSMTNAAGVSSSQTFSLASSDAHVSFDDYANLLQTAANNAFAGSGTTFTASFSNGQFSLTADQADVASVNLSGASVTSAFGGDIGGTYAQAQAQVNKFYTMDDVAAAITDDLGADGEASFDAASGTWTFSVTSGNEGASSSISLSGAGLSAIQFGGTLSASGEAGNATAAKLSEVSVTSAANATAAIKSIDNAIQYVSNQRSYLGAIQNRLDYTVNNLTNIVTNTSASRSRIEDADYGTETAALAKNQIMSQAATAMLAQANQSAQNVLSLLK